MRSRSRLFHAASVMALSSVLAACASPDVFTPAPHPTAEFTNIGYATWTDDEPAYRLYPGDEIEVQVPSAPELGKTVTVQPDGRVSLPLIDPVLIADRSIVDAEAMISTAYASQLLNPRVTIGVRAQPLKVFVGGEVLKPGVYDMPGDINALQAVILAGGYTNFAKRNGVVLIRRGPQGKPMMRLVDLRAATADPGHFTMAPLRRFDIIYIPKTGVAEAGDFVQQYIRNVLPVSAGFSYAAGSVATF
jgi:protein involved in polysaccharide export with SLBB domain